MCAKHCIQYLKQENTTNEVGIIIFILEMRILRNKYVNNEKITSSQHIVNTSRDYDGS